MEKTSVLLTTLCFILLCNLTALAQNIKTMDIVKVNARYEKEALYFYNENWKAFRNEALKKGFISGFEMLRTATDSTNHFQLILITEYADSTSFQNMERNFEPIMKAISPKGPRMLNEVPRKEFLEYIVGYDALSIISKQRKAKRK